MDSSAAAIRVRSLVKQFGPLRAVDGLDLEVRRGECFGLLGPNGAGKTTTIEILEGLQRPTSGDVEILGLRFADSARAIKKKIGIQLQETRLYERFTTEETLATFRSFYDAPRAIEDVLAAVGLAEKRATWIEKLSGGQKQRLALGCALVADPELIFLDEPTTGLDPVARRGVWEIVRSLKAQGRTVLLTTHYMEEAEVLCDRIAIVNRGRVIALGTPRELIASLGAAAVVEVETDRELSDADVGALPGVAKFQRHGKALQLSVGEIHAAVPALLAALDRRGIALERLITRHATLDDVFLAMTGSTIEDAERQVSGAGSAAS